ncbi:CDP-alcohol phosphatidyltransferase family protein [Spirochaeta lutea]|uniref:CDP-alcohol phosphatidyltransferase n=1 Tax=Spirochaeta lutea TaxID=1480694 RepID=A0A098R2T7_9SPIO|nr:CDP-alcohol phosphatidyltransferase family protein [Spirochaeta lutea]KGE73983.1 hypothetical protein DC28_02080 [Spirochaeta lutea]
MHKRALLQLPDILSFSRLFWGGLVLALVETHNTVSAFIVFCIACGSDVLDGYLARKLGVNNRWGWLIDAGSDFAFVLTILLYFTVKGSVPASLIVIVTSSFCLFASSGLTARSSYDRLGKYIGLICFVYSGALILAAGTTLCMVLAGVTQIYICTSFLCKTGNAIKNFRLRMNQGQL